MYMYMYYIVFFIENKEKYLFDTTKLLFAEIFLLSLFFFLDEFNVIMGVKLFWKLGKPSKAIIPVAKLENCLIL